jgi:hypothetical protein
MDAEEAENNTQKGDDGGENSNENNNNNNNNGSNSKIMSSSEGQSKPKRQMKTPFQLEMLEKAYACMFITFSLFLFFKFEFFILFL